MSCTNLENLKNDPAVKNFQKYLRIRSVHPNIDYSECIEFVKQQAQEIGIPVQVVELVPTKLLAILTWEGLQPELPSILLSGHMDVVPVEEDKWTHDPFGAEITPNGNIYARGAQDMKSNSIEYLEAIRKLKNSKIRLKRTVHIIFTPDEEIGGTDGMELFVKSPEFKGLNVGFAIDEGTGAPLPDWIIFHGEKVGWQIEITCLGTSGHACIMLNDTAAEKVQYILNTFLKYREQNKILIKNPLTDSGNYTSVNLTNIQGGVQDNVVPNEIKLVFDCRVAVEDAANFEEFVRQTCQISGVSLQYKKKDPIIPNTKLEGNPFWEAFQSVANKRNQSVLPAICPGVTDGRFMREMGIPVIGFSPLVSTPVLLHANDEFINIQTFLNGINIFGEIIEALGNV